jgi:predicted component of type VI protein secretion system
MDVKRFDEKKRELECRSVYKIDGKSFNEIMEKVVAKASATDSNLFLKSRA